jgi:hypothetical protein
MERETAVLFGVAIIIGAIFGAIYAIGLQPPDQSGSVTEPPKVDVPPELIESIRDDPPLPRFSEEELSPGWPDIPENEILMPPEPGPDDALEPPEENPQDCIEMEFVDPPPNVTAGEAFTLKFHERARTPDYHGNVLNFIFITPANSSDVIAQVPLQYGEQPFRSVDIGLSDGDGYSFGPTLDLSKDGETLLGYTWTPRQSEEWWLPIDMSILEPGEYIISMAAYDVTKCVRVAEDIATEIKVTDPAAEEEWYFTNVTANGLDVEMETNTTYNLDITADATSKYLRLLNDSLRQEPNGTLCHLNENDTAFSWRLDLKGADVSDMRYSHFLRAYFVGDPADEGFPGTRTPESIDGGIRLSLGAAPMAHAYSAYGMGQQYYNCSTTFSDTAPWNATMEGAIFFSQPGTYHGQLYLVGPDGEDASERLAVSITVTGGQTSEIPVPQPTGEPENGPAPSIPEPSAPTPPSEPSPPAEVPNETPAPSDDTSSPEPAPPDVTESPEGPPNITPPGEPPGGTPGNES